MSGAKHTLGPWFIFQPYSTCIKSLNGTVIANTDNANQEANARLIAAAPDLLSSLFEILDYQGDAANALNDESVVKRAHAAIAKATGEA